MRDSPALDVAQVLHGLGARVTVYDPVAMPNAARVCPGLEYAPTATAAVAGAGVVMLLTDWPEFAALTPAALGEIVEHKRIVDGRNVLDPAEWLTAGWAYRELGVGTGAGVPAEVTKRAGPVTGPARLAEW